ncbi:ABC transporter related protein [Caldicellulosiruptor hydrothermalis 108]|uniref:ABC transporter related protein n=1 Tax=Caldicellulosiruptor hydrothermalis (strain DSM 18901 / VKM B-2411 / 108) TaxID=632292 RepID=E4QCG0_CALH1|nr:ABC transporter ATP-binding protein [Caldicellulosiruptor hydrothermalis]ADQ06256.1 ABC transporter related protein [Caldicellulosiruptor hydrothermalis 108]
MPLLEIEGLTKFYGKKKAVDNLSFSVEEGQIFGFVGPNGAGKTTTMKIMCGLLRADGGCVKINGMDISKNLSKVKSLIGYMPDFFGVYDNLKVNEYLEFFAHAYRIKGTKAQKMIDDLLELVRLTDKKYDFVDSLSRGMKQRLCLARCLIHNPLLLVLDEPASGMDPQSRIEMKEILKNLKDMGKTIIISSHILPELSELCTHVGIINQGRMVAQGDIAQITMLAHGTKRIKVRFVEDFKEALTVFKEFPAVSNVQVIENGYILSFDGDDNDMFLLIKGLIDRGARVCEVGLVEGSLEEAFMKAIQAVEN